ncbi:hypothetical protein A9K72_31790 [Mesorhizobium loti]|nr:hypothetical protein BAE41_31260 [Mesorhizobium loti]OBP92712.1 hypothetical protein BAE38_31255 [Mesorhizobium loti]OBQ73269.1 hypothetical protein A9K72_31790 [Mesorhizobium loti]
MTVDPVAGDELGEDGAVDAAWGAQEGEIRPTARAKPKQKRGRRRPDPLVKVTGQLRAWFDEEPWRTSRELLVRLQAEQPGQLS